MVKKTKTKQQLADEYAITRKTFTRILAKKGIIIPRGLLTPLDIITVYSNLGFPERLSDDEKRAWIADLQVKIHDPK